MNPSNVEMALHQHFGLRLTKKTKIGELFTRDETCNFSLTPSGVGLFLCYYQRKICDKMRL
jgi:transposase